MIINLTAIIISSFSIVETAFMDTRKTFFSDVSVRCAAFLMAYYMTNSVFQSFMSLYYADIGLNNTQIGTINALIAAVSVFSMQLWGAFGDRAKVRNRLLCSMCVSAGLIMLSVTINSAFIWVLSVICLFSSFYTSIQPMGDSIVLTSLDKENRPFGPVRMAGGLSFAVVAAGFGYVVEAAGSVSAVYVTAGMCFVTALSALYMPRVSGGTAIRRTGGMLGMFKNRELLILFALMVPLQITYGYFYAFFSPLLRDDLGGGAYVGWAYFISSVCEVPFLLNSDRLFKRLGAGRLMCVSALFMSVRWLIVASTSSPVVAMLSQALHAMGFIVITVTVSKYVQATVPESQKASGQLLVSVFGFGIARVIGYFGGGVMSDLSSRQHVFYLCAGICIACLAVFVPYYFRRPPLNGEKTDG